MVNYGVQGETLPKSPCPRSREQYIIEENTTCDFWPLCAHLWVYIGIHTLTCTNRHAERVFGIEHSGSDWSLCLLSLRDAAKEKVSLQEEGAVTTQQCVFLGRLESQSLLKIRRESCLLVHWENPLGCATNSALEEKIATPPPLKGWDLYQMFIYKMLPIKIARAATHMFCLPRETHELS